MSKIIFLGTGTSQGIPMIGCNCHVCRSTSRKDKRLRTSAYIEHEGFKILIDCGPDFRQQMLNEGLMELDAVLLTHNHKDHTGGLDDIRAINYITKSAVPIYSEAYVQNSIKMEYSYAFAEKKYPGVPEYNLQTITEEPFYIKKTDSDGVEKSLKITPIRVMHFKLPIFGYRIGDLVYITDGKTIPATEYAKMEGVKVLVINAVRFDFHMSHFSLDEAIEQAVKINAEATYLTHQSHQLGTHKELTEVIMKKYKDGEQAMPKKLAPAYDGLELIF